MALAAGSTYYTEFSTSNASTGAAQNADSLPVATLNRNGADDSAVTLTVANKATGRYTITGTIPSTYTAGDNISISVTATVSSVAGGGIVDRFVLAYPLNQAPPGFSTASALTTTAAVQQMPNLAGGNLTAWINQLVPQACAIIETYCKRTFAQATYTEYYSGRNEEKLVLRQRPVTAVLNVWEDPTGYFGQASGAFASTTLLVNATDYVLDYDDGVPQSNSGLLIRLRGAFANLAWPYWPIAQAGSFRPLSASPLPRWFWGRGNIKVQYTAGYATIPSDLQSAANMLVAWMIENVPQGNEISSESMGAYSYSISTSPALGGVRQILSRYKELSVG